MKTIDKAIKMCDSNMWYLYIDDKLVTAKQNNGVPLSYFKEYIKKNNITGKVAKVVNSGTNSTYTFSVKDV